MSVADRALDGLGPGLASRAGDLLPALVTSLTEGLDVVDGLVGGEDGWSTVFDLDVTPFPSWLGSTLGVTTVSADLEGQRDEVRARGAARGKIIAIAAAARSTLTGLRRVLITERVDGYPYRIEVVTFASETPDPDATRRAVMLAKPAGLRLSYAAPLGKTYRQLRDEGLTYGQLKATGKTYDTLRKELPDG